MIYCYSVSRSTAFTGKRFKDFVKLTFSKSMMSQSLIASYTLFVTRLTFPSVVVEHLVGQYLATRLTGLHF